MSRSCQLLAFLLETSQYLGDVEQDVEAYDVAYDGLRLLTETQGSPVEIINFGRAIDVEAEDGFSQNSLILAKTAVSLHLLVL
jgi:hypothetical protein